MSSRLLTCGAAAALLIAGGARPIMAEDSRLAFGLRGGLSLSSFNGRDAGSSDAPPLSRVGFSGGAFVAIRIARSFQIQPELLYSQKGARYDIGEGELSVKLDYVELPILLKARFATAAVTPAVFAGPAVAFKVRGRVGIAGREEDAEGIQGTDLGVVFGAGVEIAAGSGRVTIDGRYTLGVRKLNDNTDLADIKNGAWSFSIGYVF